MIFLLCPSIFQFLSPPWPEPCHPPEPESVLTSCRALLCPPAPACNNSSISVTFFASHSPNMFCTRSKHLPVYPFFKPNHDLQSDAFPISQNLLTKMLVLHIFLASSCVCLHFPTPHASIPAGFCTPFRSMFRLLSFFGPRKSTFLLASTLSSFKLQPGTFLHSFNFMLCCPLLPIVCP